jgi:hypothetical protein
VPQVLGTGELSKPLTIKAAAFSGSAKEKIAAAGGSVEEVAQRAKWTRKAYEKLVAECVAPPRQPPCHAALRMCLRGCLARLAAPACMAAPAAAPEEGLVQALACEGGPCRWS